MRTELVYRFCFIIAAALCAMASATAEVPIQGTVKGNTLSSSDFPIGSVTFNEKFKYVGTTAFVLYGVANCEIHVYAEIEGKQVQRYYWVQFEGFLPSKPSSSYNYSKDPQRTMIGGHAFHERSWFSNVEEARKKMRPGSDSEAVLKLFDEKGLSVGPDVMAMRLVRLSEDKRKELMIIYSENLAPHGVKAADFLEGGSAVAKRDALIDGLRQHAIDGVKMEMR